MAWSWEDSACTLVACQSVVCVAILTYGMELGRSEHLPISAMCVAILTYIRPWHGVGRSERLPNSACTLVACQSVCVLLF